MKKPVKLFWFILVFGLCFTYLNIFGQLRNISTIDDSWKFKLFDDPNSSKLNFDDSNWETVTLPHTWNNYDGQDGNDNYYRGAGWYRKSFHLNNVSGKCIFLKFNSANLKTEVFINGSPVGTHIGGYSAFIFNITKYVIQGSDNLIAVKVRNDASLKFAPLAGDFTFCGGITKSVELWVTGNVLISPLDYASPGVYITPANISESHADIKVKVLLANYSNLNAPITEKYTIKDAHNITVNSLSVNSSLSSQTECTVSHNLSINNPVLWQGLKNPYLYTLEISLTVNGTEVDQLTQKFGVRYLGSLPDSGIYLNGKRYPLNGVAFHEDRKNKGKGISDMDRKQDLELLKETGLNYLRLAHYQHGQFTYNYCDSAGIILWTEIPLLEKIDNSNSSFSDNIKEQLKELIKQNYNHPSVCFWGLFNEIQTQVDSPDALQVVTDLNSLAKSLDSTRYTVAATNMDIPSNSIPDLISWNLYFGWYYLEIPDFSSFLDNRHKYNPAMIIGVSEYGAGASINDHEENPAKPIIISNYHPEEYQNYFHEEHWKYIKQRKFIWETSIWAGFDFASDARNEGDDKGINDKGLITHDRLVKKDAYFFYKANWSSSPIVYITSRRYNERTEPFTSAKVYSNSDSVKLLVNNKSYGYLKSSDHIFIKNILLADGPNMIKALGIKNGHITRDSCIWYLNSIPDEIIRINFETNSTITPSGYKADKGNVYGDRGNGLTYGWNEDNTTNARERFLATDKAFDTFIHLQPGIKEYSWEIAVKNGTYAIYVACGDPAYFDSHHKLMIENKTVIDFIPNATSPWLTANDTVVVSDGKLTVHAAGGGINTKINFIHLNLINSSNIVPNIISYNVINGNDLQFNFEEIPVTASLNAYRDTIAFFVPDKAGGSNRKATHFTDEDPITPGVQWTDEDVIGNSAKNYFYIFTTVDGSESENSPTVGEFDYNLVTTPTTDFNEIALPLNIEGITNAAQLMSAIPGCNSVARWNATSQGYEQYISFIPPTNFTVEMGYPYYVNVTGNAVFTLIGEIAKPTFILITTPTTDFNEVMLTLNKATITSASALMTDIPNCNSIARWNSSSQGYQQYISFIPPTNFGVRVGYPYYVNVNANTSWPSVGGLKNTVNEDVPISRNCAPHLIYGTLRLNNSNIQESELSFSAFSLNNPEDKLNSHAAGCMIKDGYWVVQCQSFPSGWKAGETIKVVFTNKDNIQLDEVDVLLSNEPADAAKEIKINETSTGYLLSQNSPNPFSDYTLIQYQIPEDEWVEVDVFSLNGEKIRTLVSVFKTAGNYEVIWNGRDDHGNKLSAGMYVYMLKSNKCILMKKSLLLK